MEPVRFVCHIDKSSSTGTDERRFWGRGYIHTTADGQVEDVSGDVLDTPQAQRELEEAFYGYVKSYRSGDANHEVFDAATMIEGFVVTAEKKAHGLFPTDMAEGVYVAFECNDSDEGDLLWEGVKSGRFSALSIVGEGWREAI